MADSRTISSSVSFAEKSLSAPSTVDINNPEFSRSNEDLIPTADDKLKLCWTGDFISLKSFVGVNVNILGVWTSPGGEKKVYSDGTTSITWLKNKKYLHFSGDKAENIKRSFCSIISPDRNSNNTMVDKAYSAPGCGSSCSCRCKEFETDFEGMKIDLVITEAKLNKNIQDNINTAYMLGEKMRELQEEVSSIKLRVDSPSRLVGRDGEEDGVVICEINEPGTILVDSICQELPSQKSKEDMIVWVEEKNTSLSPHESSYARENQPHNNKDNHANQLSNLNDVLEENKRKNVADLNTQIRAYRAKHNEAHKSSSSNAPSQSYGVKGKKAHNKSQSSLPNKSINKSHNHKSQLIDSMSIHNTPPIFRPPNRVSHFKSNNIANRYKVNSTRHYGDEPLFRERVMNRTVLHRNQIRSLDWRKYLEHVHRVTRS